MGVVVLPPLQPRAPVCEGEGERETGKEGQMRERQREGVLRCKLCPSLKELSGGEGSSLLFPSVLHPCLLDDRAMPRQDEQGEARRQF